MLAEARAGVAGPDGTNLLRKEDLRTCECCGVSYAKDDPTAGLKTFGAYILCGTCTTKHALVGKEIGQYLILKPIGAGAMGSVYKAAQTLLERVVALKVLKPELAKNQELKQRFMQEARSGAKLIHPNIVQFIDTGESDGFQYLALEFVDGKNLQELMEKRRVFTVREAANIVCQTLEALTEAFRQNVIHRDIKPANIMLSNSGVVKLSDFGLGKRLDDAGEGLTMAGGTMGTLAYMPPEQVEDSSSVDGRADIYALGATFYHLITGIPPFTGKTMTETVRKVLSEDPPPIKKYCPDVPNVVEKIIAKSMAKDFDKRYQKPESMLRDLRTVIAAGKI
jgi:serine/threonine-protein kinase